MGKNKYKKYILRTILLLPVVPVILAVGIFILPAQYDDTFLGELKYKKELLKNTDGKRIVLVGGSSLAFGIDSALMEENFQEYSVVNFGMYAGLGTTVMLDLSIDDLNEGDIVIISPEQDEQTLSDYFNASYMWQAADGAFSLLIELNRDEADAMLGAAPAFSIDKWNAFITRDYPEGSGVYQRSSFNSYGDIDSEECRANIMSGGYDKNQRISFSQDLIDEAFIERINAYVSDAEKKGAAVYFSFSPMNGSAVSEEEAEQTEEYYLTLAEKLDCEIIGNPNDRIMDCEWFYDTNFHLNNSGKIVNTYQWIKDIKAVLGDSSATEIDLPEQPALLSAAEYEGDDSDSSYFTWETGDGGSSIILTGLTEEGMQRKELIVPTHIDGMYVSEISESCFAGNTVVETVTVQKNISSLPDEMFSGCSSLKTVILQDMAPADCLVGRNLLDGCSASIAVNEEYVSEFKTDYSWSGYKDKITVFFF